MRVLVAGGAGYIGSCMVKGLSDNGHTPVVLDDLSTGNRKTVDSSIMFYEGDLGDTLLLDGLFKDEKIDLVMHFAAKIKVGESMGKPDFYYRNNVVKVLALLDLMRKHNCNMFIFSSTAAVYGSPQYLPVDEKHPTNPINVYGNTKRMVETILEDYGRAFGLKSVILRYFNAAGAALDGSLGEAQKVKQNLVPILLDNLEHDRVTTIYGNDWDTRDGTCIRDYIHIEDIVSAHLKAVDYLAKGGDSDTFNVGSESGATVREVIEAVSSVTGKNVKSSDGPRRQGDPAELVASNGKAKKILGWNPEHSNIETIVQSAAAWHFNRRY